MEGKVAVGAGEVAAVGAFVLQTITKYHEKHRIYTLDDKVSVIK
ncbi:hypothetical protein PV433_20795 [Paenibacillus sp. GYB004]